MNEQVVLPQAPEEEALGREDKVLRLLEAQTDSLWREIPRLFPGSPKTQKRCLEYLLEADSILGYASPSRADIIECRLALTKIRIEWSRVRGSRKASTIVLLIVYTFVALGFAAFRSGLLTSGGTAADLNRQLVMGVPLPVLIWATIGAFTSMLLRAEEFPFVDLFVALRWFLFRPIVGIVMGVLTYLLVTAGLVVFSGSAQTQVPELIWVIAFVGGFSDILSRSLLQGILGQFKPVEASAGSKEQERDRDEISKA